MEARLSVLEAGLGGPERHLGDYCMLLNGLGRFQNALGTLQEAPERESLIFQWFWEGLGGQKGGATLFDPPTTFRAWAVGRGRGRVLSLISN